MRTAFAAAALLATGPHALAQGGDNPTRIEGVAEEGLARALRASLPARDPPKTLLEAERIADEAAERARLWLRSEGFYAGEVQSQAEEAPNAAPAARLVVTLGDRFVFAETSVSYADEAPSAEAAAAVAKALAPIAPGAPARAEDVLAAEAAAVAALRAEGYADAAAGERTATVDYADGRMRLAYVFRTGGLSRLGRVRIEPEDVVVPRIAQRLQTWPLGTPYAPERLEGARDALLATGAFNRVEARLAEPGQGALRDVVLNVTEAEPRVVALGASWSSAEGAGAEASWTYRNGLNRADEATVELGLAEREQRLVARLDLPQAAGLSRVRSYVAGLVRENVEPFERDSISISTGLTAQSWVKTSTGYGLSVSYDSYSAISGVNSALVFAGFGEARRDTTARALDPRQGAVLSARVEPSLSTGEATLGFVRSTAEARAFTSPGAEDRVTLAGRLAAGWVQPLWGSADDLPLDRRFYAGGGGSVRGYAFRSIFPERLARSLEPPGGQGLAEGSIELRTRFGERWGAAVFADAATVFDAIDDAEPLRTGIGVGVRYDLGFGPLRFDVATPLDRREQDNPVEFYVSLGQAF